MGGTANWPTLRRPPLYAGYRIFGNRCAVCDSVAESLIYLRLKSTDEISVCLSGVQTDVNTDKFIENGPSFYLTNIH